MARVDEYRNYVEKLIREHGSHHPSNEDVETQLIFDREHDHYQLYITGWNKNRRVHWCLLHVDIKDGKICIQHDGTEDGIANELAALGVPQEDIVLAFHAPSMRKYTGFAEG
jgi:hypothetical protein